MVNVIITHGQHGQNNINMSNTFNHSIYRQQAIDKLNNAEDLTTTLTIVTPSAVLWLIACILLLTSFLIWSILGAISFTSSAQGIVINGNELRETENAMQQMIAMHEIETFELFDLYNKKLSLYQQHYITRSDLLKAEQDYHVAKQQLDETKDNLHISWLKKDKDTNYSRVILAFIDHHEGKKILPGMPVKVLENGCSVFDKSYIEGRVINVSSAPISKQLANAYLHNTSLIDIYFSASTPFMVKILLNNSDAISHGTTVSTLINYKTCSPIRYITKTCASFENKKHL